MSGNMLYWGSGSAPCWRLMIVLKEKGVQYEDKMLSFSNKEHKTDEMFKLNPRGQLPTFVHGDIVLCESAAACEFIEDQYKDKGNPLMPSDPKARNMVMQRKHEFISNLSKLYTDLGFMMGYASNLTEEEKTKRLEAAKAELKVWDGYAKATGAYIAGDAMSLADAVVFPNIAFLVRMGLTLEGKYPGLDAYYKRMCERQSVKDTWPPHWKEGPGPRPIKDQL